MMRRSLALFGAAGVLLGVATGCMKPAANAGPAPLVIPVGGVSAPPLAVSGPVDAPHPAFASDGYDPGDRVVVESGGSWLPATLIERHGDRWLVRYEAGWSGSAARDSQEEMVERARIRVVAPHQDEEHSPDDADP